MTSSQIATAAAPSAVSRTTSENRRDWLVAPSPACGPPEGVAVAACEAEGLDALAVAEALLADALGLLGEALGLPLLGEALGLPLLEEALGLPLLEEALGLPLLEEALGPGDTAALNVEVLPEHDTVTVYVVGEGLGLMVAVPATMPITDPGFRTTGSKNAGDADAVAGGAVQLAEMVTVPPGVATGGCTSARLGDATASNVAADRPAA
ncbi:hypothetical protein [Streptomyces sp. NPDC048419]|uniref:hypothetical protein n=1 Tax=Streptomyces sp. NPDC048419 TaxID=3365547 RepID=UPI003715AAF8